ncbi:MAG: hypothetical protein IH614_18260 [Desulfuromonadales bacterium]|nr:hypothetical protein [Desulfuromonadales bacterium]
MGRKSDERAETLEAGDIYFFYRPRVGVEEPAGKDDLQRLYMILHPAQKERYRLAVIGRKELPDPAAGGRARYWGYVETVRKDPASIRKELGGEEYRTRTRGERHLPAARPAGEGVYRLLRHGDHTHLIYALELPEKPGEVQEELNIAAEASYIISIANPQKRGRGTPGLVRQQTADYPKPLQDAFHGRKFADADPPAFLDHEGAEFLLIAASDDIRGELGVELQTDEETPASADIFHDLRLDRKKRPIEPLFEGKWE